MAIFLSLQEINPCLRSVGQDYQSSTLGSSRIIYDYEIIYCHRGSISVHYKDFSKTAYQGEFLIIVPSVLHTLDYSLIKEVYWVHFDFFYHNNQNDVARYIQNDKEYALSAQGYRKELARTEIIISPKQRLPEKFTANNPEDAKRIFLQLIDFFQKKNYGWQIQTKILMNDLIYQIFEHLELTENTSSNYLQITQAILDYIKEHSYRKISAKELSNQFHYHQDTLNRIVKKTTSKSISSHIKEIRIEKVKKLLLYSTMTLDEIAIHSGFNDRSHLIKTFKALEHITPAQYKKAKKENS